VPRLSQPFKSADYTHNTSPPERAEWFRVKIIESNFANVPTSEGLGEMLNFDFECIEGRETGDRYTKTVWRCGFWYDHEKRADWVGWGRTDLAKIAVACGKPDIEDTDELTGCELLVKVGPQTKKPQYPRAFDFAGIPVEKPDDHEHYVPDRHDHKDGADDYKDDEIPF
tara:strand:+ start:327 stop:833 length:507 start_codon:yes stop_codon:yes gene_type:complete